ncbi:hypothetical protein AAES_140615 [Amazona aestiva]|uniref:Uncharacterized protein n=1 Tax=Amazona aestiva TaxID=12930 RepID=A0A0Q3P5K1_AMAAE|nr:hypothetical protein AAES_140615 [Amazona aestiva]
MSVAEKPKVQHVTETNALMGKISVHGQEKSISMPGLAAVWDGRGRGLIPGRPAALRCPGLVLASVFVRLRGAEGERPQELLVAEPARESGPGDQEAGRERLLVEEVGAVEEGKEAAAEQWEEATEEQSPEADPSPAGAKSIPWQPPTEPCEPKPQEDAGDHSALPSKAEEEDLDSDKEELVVREPASTAATPAPVASTAVSSESSEGFEWPLGTLETCLLIVMGISMLACIQSVFYPHPFRLVPRVNQSGVWALSEFRQRYRRTKRFSSRLDRHEWQGVWDSMGKVFQFSCAKHKEISVKNMLQTFQFNLAKT